MSSKLFTYSMIHALYDEGQDYIDSFWPLVLRVVKELGDRASYRDVQSHIKSQYGLTVPLHSLQIISTRAARKGMLIKEERHLILNEKGSIYADSLEKEDDAKRRVNELLNDCRDYLAEHHDLSLSIESIEKEILNFVMSNGEALEEFLGPKRDEEELPTFEITEHQAAIIDYFAFVEENKEILYRTLKDLLYGSIIAGTLHGQELALIGRKFDKTVIVLDTNLLFRVLGLDFDFYTNATQELFRLLKDNGNFELRVFDFSIEEAIRVLKAFISNEGTYLKDVRVSSIHSNLKTIGWTPAIARSYIAKIEKKIKESGILIIPTEINLNNYKSKLPTSNTLERYKPHQSNLSRNHDLAAIEQVRKERGASKRIIEACHVIFLTCDLRLARFAYLELGHADNETISEVIPDQLLTNILWLKDPESVHEIPIRSLIALHSRGLLINNNIWRKFFNTIRSLRSKDVIDDEETSVLMFDGQVHELLEDVRPANPDLIDENWVLDNLEGIKNRLEERNKEELRLEKEVLEERSRRAIENQMKIEQQLTFELDQAGKQKEQTENQAIEAISKAKKEIENDARNLATRLNYLIGAILVIFAFTIAYLIRGFITENWSSIEPVSFIVSLALSALFLTGYFKYPEKHLKERMELLLFNWLYIRKIHQSHLDEIEKVIG